jgi:non-specific serine/threonine protein kinase
LLAAREHPQVNTVAEEAQSAAETFDPSLVPQAMALRASSMAGQDLAKAITLLETAFAEAERMGSTEDMALALFGLGWNLGAAGRITEAERALADSVALCANAGDLSMRGAVQLRRALVRWLQGDLELMTSAATDALRASRLVYDRYTCANALCLIGVAAVGREDHLAAMLFGTAERFWEDADGSVVATPPWQDLLNAAEVRCRATLAGAAFEEQYRRGWQRPMDDAISAALNEHPAPAGVRLALHDFGLTRREIEVVDLLSQGLTNKEIANRLVISPRTAETHVQNVLSKTGFKTRAQVAAWRAAQLRAEA